MGNLAFSLLALLLITGASAKPPPGKGQAVGSQAKLNPYVMTPQEKAYIINTFAGEELINYSKSTKTELYVSNNLYSTYRGTPWVELIYKNGTTTEDGLFFDVWNSCIVEDQANTIQDMYLDYSSDPPDRYNFNKRFTVDMDIIAYYTQEQLVDIPLTKTFPFTTDPGVSVQYQYAAPTFAFTSNTPFSESYVYRWNTWVFYPRTSIYLLIKRVDPSEVKIYILQAMASNQNQQLTEAQLVLNPVPDTFTTNPLTPSIEPPAGWTFAYLTLDRFLPVPARGQAHVISDNLSNAYMWIYPDAAPWLYEKYQTA